MPNPIRAAHATKIRYFPDRLLVTSVIDSVAFV